MKIVLIHGQAHKGSTWHIADMLLQNIECEKQVREFFLPRELNHFCLLRLNAEGELGRFRVGKGVLGVERLAERQKAVETVTKLRCAARKVYGVCLVKVRRIEPDMV